MSPPRCLFPSAQEGQIWDGAGGQHRPPQPTEAPHTQSTVVLPGDSGIHVAALGGQSWECGQLERGVEGPGKPQRNVAGVCTWGLLGQDCPLRAVAEMRPTRSPLTCLQGQPAAVWFRGPVGAHMLPGPGVPTRGANQGSHLSSPAVGQVHAADPSLLPCRGRADPEQPNWPSSAPPSLPQQQRLWRAPRPEGN